CEWYKVSKRREMDISTVAACFTVDLDRAGIVRHARLAYGGVAAMPSRALKTEDSLLGKPWTAETVESVLPILETEFTPISGVRGGTECRGRLITSLFERFYFNSCKDRRAEKENSHASSKLVAADVRRRIAPAKNRPLPHESAHKHVTGEAM